MKHRHALVLTAIILPVCALLRIIQIYFTIEGTTGFIKQQYKTISVLITVIICAATAALGLLAATLEGMRKNDYKQRPFFAIVCALTGGMFFYQTVAGATQITNGTWYNLLLALLSLMSAFVFVVYGFKNIYDFELPALLYVIPVSYYIVKLISIFVSTSELARVTENVFLIFTNGILLWFMFEFASLEGEVGNLAKKPKRLFASGLSASVLCCVVSLPKLIVVPMKKITLTSGDISESLLALSMGIFILTYIICNFVNNNKESKSLGRHSV